MPREGRPKVENPNVIVKSIRLNQDLIDRINAYAKKNGITFGKAVKIALEKYFK